MEEIKNQKKKLKITDLAPLVWTTDLGSVPAIPYKQQIIELPRNLLTGTSYIVGTKTSERASDNIIAIMSTLNNITEALSYIILEQNPELNENSNNNIEEIHIELDKLLQKILKYLEQNRIDIETSIRVKDAKQDEKYQNLYKHQEGLRNLLIETKEIVSQQTKVEEKLEKIEKVIKELDQKEEIDRLNRTLEEVNKKLNRL